MNDFKKKELEDLIFWADYCVGSGLCYTETEPLYGKIKFMIDNYCNHKYKKTLSKSGMYFISMCHKCKKENPYV